MTTPTSSTAPSTPSSAATSRGRFAWYDLMTTDVEGAKAFYGQVFGWTSQETRMGEHLYTAFTVGENPAGGMMPMAEPMFPPEIPPHWMAYFSVTDCDAVCAHAEKLGGSVFVPPTDIPPGRFAVLGDPQGAFFSIIQNTTDSTM